MVRVVVERVRMQRGADKVVERRVAVVREDEAGRDAKRRMVSVAERVMLGVWE
jgi:hypothetical protein